MGSGSRLRPFGHRFLWAQVPKPMRLFGPRRFWVQDTRLLRHFGLFGLRPFGPRPHWE